MNTAFSTEDSHLYEQVAGKVVHLIRSGALRAGDRIPSVRQTSADQSVSVSTVLQAYFLLENQGFIEARPQSGFYVRARLESLPPLPKISAPPSSASHPNVSDLIMDVISSIREPDVVPLGAATIAPHLLPLQSLSRFTAKAARTNAHKMVAYEVTPGNVDLRRQIARRNVTWDVPTNPDEVITTCGGTEALNLALRAVAEPGETVAIESPCYYGILQIIENMGFKALEIPTDPEEGLCLSSLASALKRHDVKAVVSVSNFNNPLGSCMPEEKKKELVELLTRRKVPLIEDDIYGDLNFGETRPKPAKAFDREGWVILCSSFSKTLAPGFRVGWVLPGRFRARVEKLKIALSFSTASLPQIVLADYLQSGGYDRHLRHLRKTLQTQVNQVSDAVARYFPKKTKMTRPAGGCVLWVEFPKSVDALRLHREALAKKISIAPGPIFSPKQKFRNCIRLNAGHPWSERFDAALRTLGELASNLA
ncbi:MAG TPA: PLP-dependent aminotransferase family protein [bacterium]|nr:PLP-dependent aminotransferase family protein [bacterium]